MHDQEEEQDAELHFCTERFASRRSRDLSRSLSFFFSVDRPNTR